jgi:hypothetical protein
MTGSIGGAAPTPRSITYFKPTGDEVKDRAALQQGVTTQFNKYNTNNTGASANILDKLEFDTLAADLGLNSSLKNHMFQETNGAGFNLKELGQLFALSDLATHNRTITGTINGDELNEMFAKNEPAQQAPATPDIPTTPQTAAPVKAQATAPPPPVKEPNVLERLFGNIKGLTDMIESVTSMLSGLPFIGDKLKDITSSITQFTAPLSGAMNTVQQAMGAFQQVKAMISPKKAAPPKEEVPAEATPT